MSNDNGRPTSPGECAVCHKPAHLRCAACGQLGYSVLYCSKSCQRDDWKTIHKSLCGLKIVRPLDYADFLLQWKSAPTLSHPVGLKNFNYTTCYANTLFQAFLATRPLVGHLLNNTQHHCKKDKAQSWCALCELKALFEEVYCNESSLIAPRELILGIHRHMQFSIQQQQDVHELYTELLNNIEDAMVKDLQRYLLTSNPSIQPPKLFELQRQAPVNYIFGYSMRSSIDCLRCGAMSSTNTPDSGLILAVPVAEEVRLTDLLAEHFKDERLEGDCAFSCDECKDKVPALKSASFATAPNILELCLNRSLASGYYGKNTTPVLVPELLDLQPFMNHVDPVVDTGRAVYKLYAILAHESLEGTSSQNGHYFAFVRHGDVWFAINDEEVVGELKIENVLQNTIKSAYVLFYERLVPRGNVLERWDEGPCTQASALTRDTTSEEIGDKDGLLRMPSTASVEVEPVRSLEPRGSTMSEEEEDAVAKESMRPSPPDFEGIVSTRPNGAKIFTLSLDFSKQRNISFSSMRVLVNREPERGILQVQVLSLDGGSWAMPVPVACKAASARHKIDEDARKYVVEFDCIDSSDRE